MTNNWKIFLSILSCALGAGLWIYLSTENYRHIQKLCDNKQKILSKNDAIEIVRKNINNYTYSQKERKKLKSLDVFSKGRSESSLSTEIEHWFIGPTDSDGVYSVSFAADPKDPRGFEVECSVVCGNLYSNCRTRGVINLEK